MLKLITIILMTTMTIIYLLDRHFSVICNWKIYPIFSILIDNKLHYFTINRKLDKPIINYKGTVIELLVFSPRHSFLNKVMI